MANEIGRCLSAPRPAGTGTDHQPNPTTMPQVRRQNKPTQLCESRWRVQIIKNAIIPRLTRSIAKAKNFFLVIIKWDLQLELHNAMRTRLCLFRALKRLVLRLRRNIAVVSLVSPPILSRENYWKINKKKKLCPLMRHASSPNFTAYYHPKHYSL